MELKIIRKLFFFVYICTLLKAGMIVTTPKALALVDISETTGTDSNSEQSPPLPTDPHTDYYKEHHPVNSNLEEQGTTQIPEIPSSENNNPPDSPVDSPSVEIDLGQEEKSPGEASGGCGSYCSNKEGKELQECLCEKIGNEGIASMEGEQCVLANRLQSIIKRIRNPIQENQPLRSENSHGFNGSAYFTGCQQKTWKNWKEWAVEIKRSRKKVDGTEHFAPYWHYKLKEFIEDGNKLDQAHQDNVPLYDKDIMLGKLLKNDECLENKIKEIDPNLYGYNHISKTPERIAKFKQMLFEMAGESNTWFAEVQVCSALLPLTAFHVDYNNSEFVRPSEAKASFDKKITCRSAGVETQDYPACLNIINIYNGAMMSQPVLQTAQAIDYQDHMSGIQHKQMKDQLKSGSKVLETKADVKEGGDDRTLTSEYDSSQITSGLKAQKSSLEKQKEIAHVRAAFHGAKGAAMLGLAQGIPDAKKLVETCSKHVSNTVGVKEYHAVLNFALNPFNGSPSIDQLFENDPQWQQMKQERNNNNPKEASYPVLDICWGGFRKANLLLNQDAKQAAIAIAVQAGAEMGTNLITGGMLDKQAKQLGEIITEVDKFKPEETYTSKVGDLDCEKTPGHPFCVQEKAQTEQKSGFLNSEYTFGNNNLTTATGETADENKSATREGGASDTTNAGKIGSIVGQSSSKGKGGFESYIPKGKVKRGRSNMRGKSGSAARVSAPRGKGRSGRSSRRRPRGGRGNSGKALAASYKGGQGLYKGGRGRSGKSKSTSKNPFANLFKKNKNKRGKNVLNFRDIAAKNDQRGSIWQMISDRYQDADKKKRLLKYKIVK